MFHWDRGLFLTAAGLALDVTRRQKLGFISHAHADHIGPHELSYCTPETAALFRHRRGQHRRVKEMRYREPIELGPLRLTALPAGHCLGSAMLLAESDEQSLLYTGDFKLDETPLVGEAFDEGFWRGIGKDGVHALVCDSTNVMQPVAGRSEATVGPEIVKLVESAPGMFVATTFASNVVSPMRSRCCPDM